MIRRGVFVLGTVIALLLTAWVIGMMLPVSHVASGSRVLQRQPNDVYRLVANVEDYPRWWSEVSRIEILSRDADGRVTFRQHGSDGAVVMQVVEHQPPARFVTRIADPEQPFAGTWTFEIQPEGTGTRLTITERGEVFNPLFRFMSRFVFGHTRTIDSYLAAMPSS